MKAYMLALDLHTVTQAKPNRLAVQFAPFGSWTLETGGGTKVPEEWLKHWPSHAVADPKFGEPTAWINAGGYCVSPSVKEAIEELAPDVHQFVPLVLEAGAKGHRKDYTYYSIHVADRADEVIVEKSDVEWNEMKHQERTVRYWSKKLSKPVVLPAASIHGKHIWWNRKCNILLASGELHDVLLESGLATGLKFQEQIIE